MDFQSLASTALKTVVGVATGGLSDRVLEIVDNVLPDSMSNEQRSALRIALQQEETKREALANDAANDQERNLTDRIAKLEGTASDLKSIPYLGAIVIFLRGAQRPTWGFAVLYMDLKVFKSEWPLQPDGYTEMAFWTINALVLGFLFGERAVKNVLPLISTYLGRRGDA